MRQSRAQRTKKKSKVSLVLSIVLGIVVVGGIMFFLLTSKDEMEQEVQPVEQGQSNQPAEVNEGTPNEGQSEVSPTADTKQPEATAEEPQPENPPQAAIQVDAGGYAVTQGEVTEPSYINGVLVANKKYPLPKTYNPGEDPTAKQAMDTLILAAKQAGYSIVAFSSFRSYEYQKGLYDKYVARDGQVNADRYSARPGHSEHQTGLAFDVGEVGREDLWLTSEFGETPAGQWLVANAHHYGFILRYPKGKEAITGFMYESWHFRYLGVELATKVYESGLTLEEYLGIE